MRHHNKPPPMENIITIITNITNTCRCITDKKHHIFTKNFHLHWKSGPPEYIESTATVLKLYSIMVWSQIYIYIEKIPTADMIAMINIDIFDLLGKYCVYWVFIKEISVIFIIINIELCVARVMIVSSIQLPWCQLTRRRLQMVKELTTCQE